jgi:NAD+ synthase (glutamine-hydrolysing)
LATRLGVELKDIPIDHVFQTYLDLLSPVFVGKPFDTTEENLQARIRGMILMAISNKWGHIVLSTGNKSEMAMGYTTLYGDMAGGLAVITDVSKTQIYQLVDWINKNKKNPIPQEIVKKPPSAELRPNQKDSDSLPDYSIVDKVLQDYVEDHLSIEEIVKKHDLTLSLVSSLVQKIHKAEYKRQQGPLGIRVTKRSFSKGRFFPIVHKWKG